MIDEKELSTVLKLGASDILKKYGYDRGYDINYYDHASSKSKESLTLTEELLLELLNVESKQNAMMIKLLASLERDTSTVKSHYYDVSDTIATAYTTDPGDIGSSNYTRLRVHELIGRNATITLFNDGPGTLHVRVAHDVEKFSASEFPLYEGEAKVYKNVYEIRMRTTVANCRYRATEYDMWKQKNVDFRAGRGYVRTQAVAVAGATVQLAYNNSDTHNFNAALTRNGSTGYIKNTNALTDLWVWFSQDGTEYGQSGAGVTVEYTTVDPNGAINIDYMDVHSVKIGSILAGHVYQIVVA